MLCADPLIVHAWPSTGFPLGSASVIGPLVRGRPAHFLIRPASTMEAPGAAAYPTWAARTYLEDHPRHGLTFLGNSDRETEIMAMAGFHAVTLNQNCLVNDSHFHPIAGVTPEYDAVYNARLAPGKRHQLASALESLALIYLHDSYSCSVAEFHARHEHYRRLLPGASFLNRLTPRGCERFKPPRVNRVLAQCRVGLCLSELEGAMLASIEYLLAGLPVVSTPSYGGRDYYFDDDYCLTVDPDPARIREAVRELIARNLPREQIRAKTLARLEIDRARYIALVQGMIDHAGGDLDFAPRFRELLRGRGIVNWRPMSKFVRKVLRAVTKVG